MIDLNLFTQFEAGSFLYAFSWAEGFLPIPKIINFILFAGGLFFLLRKPFSQAMRERRELIQADLKRAKAEKEAAEAKLREIEGRLNRLDSEIGEIRAAAEQEAKAEYERLIKQAQGEAERMRLMAEREIEGASRAAQIELREFAATKSVELAESMIRQEIKPEDNARLVQDFVRELEEVK